VTVQGRGIALPLGSACAVGFVRLVQVRSRDPLAAEIRAIEQVGADWARSPYALRNLGAAPNLTVAQIGLLSWWHRFLGAPRGYLFFTEEGFQLRADPRLEYH